MLGPAAQAKGVQDAGAAAVRVSGLEVGGLFGSLLAGRISDWMVKRSNGKGGNVGKRVQVGFRSLLPPEAHLRLPLVAMLSFAACPGLPYGLVYVLALSGFCQALIPVLISVLLPAC